MATHPYDTYQPLNPFEHWLVRTFNTQFKDIGKLPDYLKDCIENDGVHPYSSIIERMRYGYFLETSFFFAVVKRVPWPDVDSFTVLNLNKAAGYTNRCYYQVYGNTAESVIKTEDETHYFHFHGEKAIRILIYQMKLSWTT